MSNRKTLEDVEYFAKLDARSYLSGLLIGADCQTVFLCKPSLISRHAFVEMLQRKNTYHAFPTVFYYFCLLDLSNAKSIHHRPDVGNPLIFAALFSVKCVKILRCCDLHLAPYFADVEKRKYYIPVNSYCIEYVSNTSFFIDVQSEDSR